VSGPDSTAGVAAADHAEHETTLAVWDVTSPVPIGGRVTITVGAACCSGCDLAARRIILSDENGITIGEGQLGPAPLVGTDALYWTRIEVAAPRAEGHHAWTVEATSFQPAHAPATTLVRVITVAPPEHRVTLHAREKGSAAPIGGVELRLGVFRATTDESGTAQLAVPAGSYQVAAWKIGYDLLSTTADVDADITIRLEVAAAARPEQPYWM
jgi:hypothetical protein